MRKHVAVITLAASFHVAAQSEPLKPWPLPDASTMIEAANILCLDQSKSAIMAVLMRENGRQREEVLALIPESPKAMNLRLVSAMRENVEDAFQYPALSKYTLYSFRSEVCIREALSAVQMPRLAVMYPKVAECQRQHGVEKSTPLFKCIQAAVREISPL